MPPPPPSSLNILVFCAFLAYSHIWGPDTAVMFCFGDAASKDTKQEPQALATAAS